MVPAGGFRRSLDRIREEGRSLDLVELARRLLGISGALAPGLARRLVAAALECPPASLPDRLEPELLAAARHGVLGCREGAPHSNPEPGGPGGLRVPLARAAFTVVDLETTGLSADHCEIVEIGAVRVERLAVTARFQTLIRPRSPVPRRITELTGIRDADLVDAPAARAALPAFRRWLARTPRATFVAHNARFDVGFLRRAFQDHALPGLPGPVLCTRRLGRRLVPELRAYNLDALSAHFGISNRARHRALGDADSTAQALIELLVLARERAQLSTLGELLDLQEQLPRRPPRRDAAARRPVGR